MTSSAQQAFAPLDDFTGEVVSPGDPQYDALRAVWNAAIDRRPAFILRCRSAQDVAGAVRFARRHDLPIAVRAGGHSIPGFSVCEGGVMIDLQPMKDIVVDPRGRTARVEPGVLWREFDAAAQAHGLATPGGEISDTGVAGLTLGGGIGWLSRLHGLAADNLLGVELCTADGELLEVTDETDPELMWGLRGGGGNFGIVTRFDFSLHPVDRFWGGMVMYDGHLSTDVLQQLLDFSRDADPATSMAAAMVTAPPAPFIPADKVGSPVIGLAAAHFGSVDDGRQILEPLRQLGRPLVDTFGETGYVDLQQMFDAGNPHGWQQYVKSDFLSGLDADATELLAHNGAKPSSPHNQLLLRRLGGRIAEVPADKTAFANRSGEYMLTVAASWPEPDADPEPHRTWVRQAWQSMRPWAAGTYVNHLGAEGVSRLKEAYPDATWRRLTALKRRLDPSNVFALNQNIPPAPA